MNRDKTRERKDKQRDSEKKRREREKECVCERDLQIVMHYRNNYDM